MGHGISFFRQAAVTCWASNQGRNPDHAATFAADSDAVVRENLARVLQDIGFDAEPYRGVVAQLQQDPSWRVRQAAGRYDQLVRRGGTDEQVIPG